MRRWFDPFISTLSFGIAMMLYWNEERKLGKTKKDRPNWLELDHVALSLILYWVGLLAFKCIVPPSNGGLIPDGAPHDLTSCLYLIIEVCSGIILYDFLFFFVHWGYHESPFLRVFHVKHHMHDRGIVEATDVLNHSFIDGSLQVLINIYTQRYTPWGKVKSRMARMLHNMIVTWMLTESHSSSPNMYISRKLFIGVKNHRLHHLSHNENHQNRNHNYVCPHYQQFFGYLDSALKNYRLSCQKCTSR